MSETQVGGRERERLNMIDGDPDPFVFPEFEEDLKNHRIKNPATPTAVIRLSAIHSQNVFRLYALFGALGNSTVE